MASFACQKKTLPGGLKLIMLPRPKMDTVTFLVLISAGSRYEAPREAGLSHFLEHMFFKGTVKRPDKKAIAEAIDNIGGEFNAFTGEEYTGYYVKVAANQLPTAADVVADILQHPLFPADEIEKERGVIIEEYKMYTDMPMRHVQHLWQKALYGNHPLGRRIDGSPKTVIDLQRRDFCRYAKKHYHTKNALVVIAGQFNASEATTQLRQLFCSLPPGEETRPRPAPAKQPWTNLISEERSHLDQTHIMVGVPSVSLTDERRYAALLLATVLGSGMSSRLFQRVREESGLAYDIHTSQEEYTDSGSLVTQMGVRSGSAGDALKIVMAEYNRLMSEDISQRELAKAKEMIKGKLWLRLEETNAIAYFAGFQQLLTKRIISPDQLVKKYDRVTPPQVKKLAQELLTHPQRAIAVLGPKQAIDQVKQTLKN